MAAKGVLDGRGFLKDRKNMRLFQCSHEYAERKLESEREGEIQREALSSKGAYKKVKSNTKSGDI